MKKFLLVLIALILIPSVANAQITRDQYYARSLLEGNELEYYDAAYDAIASQTNLYRQDYGIGEERSQQIINYVYSDSPELINGHKAYSQEEVEELNTQLKQKAKDIIAEIPSEATEYQKVIYVYEYLAKNVRYSEEIDDGQTIVGGILYKKAVCSGISRSLQYLLYKMDINCITASTDVHAWNIVQIDGEWYHLDLTSKMERRGDVELLLYSDNYYSGWIKNATVPLPACTSDKYMKPEPTIKPTPQPTVLSVTVDEPIKEQKKEPPYEWYAIGGIGILAVLVIVRKAVLKRRR